jgi:hypothetical protein
LADNILGWQKNAKNILTTEEVVSAMRRLGDETQWPLTSHWEGKFITLEDRTPPEIKLSAKTVKILEEMLVAGDSLEVSVPEKEDILKLLSAVEPRRSRKFPGKENSWLAYFLGSLNHLYCIFSRPEVAGVRNRQEARKQNESKTETASGGSSRSGRDQVNNILRLNLLKFVLNVKVHLNLILESRRKLKLNQSKEEK